MKVTFIFEKGVVIDLKRLVNNYTGKQSTIEVKEDGDLTYVLSEVNRYNLPILDNKFRLFEETEKYKGYIKDV